jgi:hypothetical protein
MNRIKVNVASITADCTNRELLHDASQTLAEVHLWNWKERSHSDTLCAQQCGCTVVPFVLIKHLGNFVV